jgi:hypothetical protein
MEEYVVVLTMSSGDTSCSTYTFPGMSRREYFDKCLLALGRRLDPSMYFDYLVVGDEAMGMGEVYDIQNGRTPELRFNSYLVATKDGLIELMGNHHMHDID